MEKDYKEIQKELSNVPKNLPFHLHTLTSAGYLHAAGYNVTEQSLAEDGFAGCCIIFTPVMVLDDESNKFSGCINAMYEIRLNALVSMQFAANECNVDYRTIQRWRDSKKIIPVVMPDGKKLFPLGIVRDYAAKQGHLKNHNRWR